MARGELHATISVKVEPAKSIFGAEPTMCDGCQEVDLTAPGVIAYQSDDFHFCEACWEPYACETVVEEAAQLLEENDVG